MTSDLELLDEYARQGSEEAFSALVHRHLDLVYSAALRQAKSPQLAEEVAQSVFTDLSQNAHKLKPDTIMSAWLYQVTRRTAIDVIRRESRRQFRERTALEMTDMNSNISEWTRVESLLEDAMEALEETDRSAILLRYFENKSLREVGQSLGTSDDAAQKRVSRAVERLREFFTKRGVTVGASGLVVIISANAVQAAPVGLTATIATAAALAGTTIAATTTATAAKAIAMTTLQKIIIGATLMTAVGTGIYEARHAANLLSQVQTFQLQATVNAQQIQRLNRERDEAIDTQAALRQENEQLRQTIADVPELRAEVARLRKMQQQPTQSKPATADMNDPFTQSILALTARARELNRYLEQMPDKKIPELELLSENDWLRAAKEAKFDTDADVRKALSKLRDFAKDKLPIGSALYSFTRANNGQLPTDLSQLRPYFKLPVDDAILERYKLLHTGNLSEFPAGEWLVAEKAPVDKDYDTLAIFGDGFSTSTRP